MKNRVVEYLREIEPQEEFDFVLARKDDVREVGAVHDPVHVPLFALLLATECHLSLNTDPRDFGVPLPEGIGPREVDLVKALSSLAMLPAYIPGVLLCAELLVPFRG